MAFDPLADEQEFSQEWGNPPSASTLQLRYDKLQTQLREPSSLPEMHAASAIGPRAVDYQPADTGGWFYSKDAENYVKRFEQLYSASRPESFADLLRFDLNDLETVAAVAPGQADFKELTDVLTAEEEQLAADSRAAAEVREQEDRAMQRYEDRYNMYRGAIRLLFPGDADGIEASFLAGVDLTDKDIEERMEVHRENYRKEMEYDPDAQSIREEVDAILQSEDQLERLGFRDVFESWMADVAPGADPNTTRIVTTGFQNFIRDDVTARVIDARRRGEVLVEPSKGFWGHVGAVVGGLFKIAGGVVEAAPVPYLGSGLGNPTVGDLLEPVNQYLVSRESREAVERIEEARAAAAAVSDDELMRRWRTSMVSSIDEYWDNEIVGTDQEQVFLSGFGSPEAAKEALATMFEESSDEQLIDLDDLRNEIDQGYVDAMRGLAESEFGFGEKVLNIVSMYSKHGPMKLLSMGTVAVKEYGGRLDEFDDFFTFLAEEGNLSEWLDEARKHDYQPSSAAGIDGTFWGLTLDYVGGALVDPLTYFFGPSGRSAAMASQASVRRFATSSVGKSLVDDAVRLGRSGNVAAARNMTRWMRGHDAAFYRKLASMAPEEELVRSLAQSQLRALNAGFRPDAASRVASAHQLGRVLRATTDDTAVANLATQRLTTRNLSVYGSSTYDDLAHVVHSTWGDDLARSNSYAERLDEIFNPTMTSNGQQFLDEATELAAYNQSVDDLIGALADEGDWSRVAYRSGLVDDFSPEAGAVSLLDDWILTQQDLVDRLRYIQASNKKQIEALNSAAAESLGRRGEQLQAFVNDMWAEYNAEHILPKWRGVKDLQTEVVKLSDGRSLEIVSWDELRGSQSFERGLHTVESEGPRKYLSGAALDEYLADGPQPVSPAALEEFVGSVPNIANRVMSVQMPISPFQLSVAASRTRRAYMRAMQNVWANSIQKSLQTTRRLWVMDKVATLRTALVVSFDELQRIWHRGGVRSVENWVDLQTLKLQRASRAPMSETRAARLRDYENVVRDAAIMERKLSGMTGYGHVDIQYDDIGKLHPGKPTLTRRDWEDAVRGYASGLMTTDKTFRKWLEGPEALAEWLSSGEGLAVALRARVGGRLLNADEIYNMYDTLVRKVWFTQADDINKLLDGLRETARKIDLGDKNAALPTEIYDAMRTVRGTQREPGKGVVSRGYEFVFHKGFEGPTNARRTLIYKEAFDAEVARITELLADQGIKLLSFDEVARRVGFDQFATAASDELLDFVEHQGRQQGLYTQRYANQLAATHALSEMDDILYKWHTTSLGGRAARTVFPFGGPWADMWGFWGREHFARPATRRWLRNVVGDGVADTIEMNAPFNPRTAAFVSRLAATDFDLEEETLWNSMGVDFSPLFFLPTGGKDPLSTMVPGMDPMPLSLVDLYIANIEDPFEAQKFIDEYSAVQPFISFTRGRTFMDMLTNRYIAGGVGARVLQTGSDLVTLASLEDGGELPATLGSIDRFLTGDISRTTAVSRALTAHMSTDTSWADLILNAESEEDLHDVLYDYRKRALQTALGGTAFRSGLSLALPISTSPTQVQSREIQEAWLGVGVELPEVFGIEIPADWKNLPADARESLTDKLRTRFLRDTPKEVQDRVLLQYPQLAPSMVSGWQWNPNLTREAVAPLVGDDVAAREYDVDGTPESLALHDRLLKQGVIVPLSEEDRFALTVATLLGAKERVHRRALSSFLETYNEELWPRARLELPPGFVGVYDQLIELGVFGPERAAGVDASDEEKARWLWENMSSLRAKAKDEIEWSLMEQGIGYDPGSLNTALNKLTSIPEDVQAFSLEINLTNNELDVAPSRWENISAAAVEHMLARSPETHKNLEALGIRLEDGISGADLWAAVAIPYLQVERQSAPFNLGALAADIRSEHYNTPARRETLSFLNNLQTEEVPTLQRALVARFLLQDTVYHIWEEKHDQYISAHDKKNMRDQYNALIIQFPEYREQLETTWYDNFRKRYGDLDFMPPEPPGLDSPGAYTPYKITVKDGDTLVVENRVSAMESVFGAAQPGGGEYEVRLIGVMAREYRNDLEGASEDEATLREALAEAKRLGLKVWLVPDEQLTGSRVDRYGRELVWLYIGDEPWYQEVEGFIPRN